MANILLTRSWYILIPILLISAAGAASGFWAAISYDARPGEAGAPLIQWPDGCGLKRPQGRAALVMVVHPGCPCSRASLSELSVLMTRFSGGIHAYVLFDRPEGFTESWEQTPLWKDAEIGGVERIKDETHLGVRAFGARTSGQVLVYDASGALQFSGGITASRGHEGENLGLEAIEAFLETGKPTLKQTPVYGCAL